MATFLLTWNPRLFPWGTLQDELAQVRRSGRATQSWSVGLTRSIRAGDRFFLIRLGKEPRWLVAAGWFASSPYLADHWDRQRAARGDQTLFADILFDSLSEEPVISITALLTSFRRTRWSSQSSGISIADEVAAALEVEWGRCTAQRVGGLPGELTTDDGPFLEGATRQVLVDAYERDPGARAACIAEHGYSCACCEMTFLDTYGPCAAQFIHVHHRKPLSRTKQRHTVDPVRDLVPVCANCHAVIHLHKPPFSVADVRTMLAGKRGPTGAC